MKPEKSQVQFWHLYKMGGLSPALLSFVNATGAQQMAFVRSLVKEKQQSEMGVLLTDLQTVVFDLETTGFYPRQGDEIISMGAVGIFGRSAQEVDSFHTLVNPNRVIPSHIEELTHITTPMVQNAPTLIEALAQFFEFVKQRTLIAHGSSHDKQFLKMALWKTSRAAFNHRLLDTMWIACKLHPSRHHFTLDDWLTYYGIPISERHNALADSRMTAKLWSSLLQELYTKRIDTLGDLYTFCAR
ncbi:exonuclease domain-containing protein [Paenibacillus sp. N1-5-1-14]|uniref:exonuclease domain-containing protein n=1 Tax=Paenibacillus radicibacter TaxID=2972488 RepID=UPI0021595965|nr:exonuclease domain-containing protein [Paenibacillus radicibacter]MCR8642628.1 exonuclease domain-containing protein [Paenibacillus radicibacter]